MTSQPRRAGRRPRYLAAFPGMIGVGCVLLAAACGSTAAPGSGAGGSVASGPSAAASSSAATTTSAAKVSLTVTFRKPGAAPKQWTLRCDPPSGNVSDPQAACVKLKAANLFKPLPARVMCPMILASAERAYISGIYYGQPVHVTIAAGGCQLSRWDKLHKIFH